MWKLESPKTLVDTQHGVVIKLLAGSWAEPLDLQPIFPKGLEAYEAARLLRSGLAYARKHGGKPTPSGPKIRKRSTLTLSR